MKTTFTPKLIDGVPEISCEELWKVLNSYPSNKHFSVKLIDVRRLEEFSGEFGHIPGAILLPQGEDLDRFMGTADRNLEIVFICRSGARSKTATQVATEMGFKHTMNLTGGMIRWTELGYSVKDKN